MKLNQLLQDVTEFHTHAENQIQGLSLNSAHVQPGEVFIALKGAQHDGRHFIQEAITKGASAVLCEAQGLAEFSYPDCVDVPIIPINNLDKKLTSIAMQYYGNPTADLRVIGVTGTSGKTTLCFLLAQALSRLHIKCGVIGTLGYGFLESLIDCTLTTPEPIALWKYLKTLKEQGANTIAMEVSSHGLDQNRVAGIHFTSAIFTNLTQDHLDYHGTMQVYGEAKQKLFQFATLAHAIINADDEYAPQIVAAVNSNVAPVLYSIAPPTAALAGYALVFAKQFTLHAKGITALVQTPWGEGTLQTSLLGEANLSNLLAVLATLCLHDIPFPLALAALSEVKAVPGRMELLPGVSPQVIIDYSHKPNPLENALKWAKMHCLRDLWCVFGCGGDRDKGKRPQMGAIAAQYADKVIITSDNPRTENPHHIIEEIWAGVKPAYHDKTLIEADRKQAIEYALLHAHPDDTLLIAGKGHETYQIIGHEKIYFSDSECVTTFLDKMKA